MTTPGILANRSTLAAVNAQRPRLEARLAELTEKLTAASAERVQATHARNQARSKYDNARNELQEHRALLKVLPQDPRRDQRIAEEAEALKELQAACKYNAAWMAAAVAVEKALVLEVDWAKLDISNLGRPANDGGRPEPVTGTGDELAIATSYTVISWFRPRDTDPFEQKLSRRKAAGLINAWLQHDGAHVLRDAAGRLYISTPFHQIELQPSTLEVAPHEGDVLAAALAEYGWKSKIDGDMCSYLVLPVDPKRPLDDVYDGRWLLIASGESADLPVSEHAEPWQLDLYGPGDTDHYVDTLRIGSPGLSLAADSAECARAVAEYAARDESTPAA